MTMPDHTPPAAASATTFPTLGFSAPALASQRQRRGSTGGAGLAGAGVAVGCVDGVDSGLGEKQRRRLLGRGVGGAEHFR